MALEYLFDGMDAYDTPTDRSISFVFRMTGRNRWYFYLDNFRTFWLSGQAGRTGRLDRDAQVAFSNRNVRLVERCGGKIHLRGLANLRAAAGRPVVLVGNHMSLLECGLLHAVARPCVDFSFVVKESLMKVPYFGDILRALGAIPVTRKNPREDLKQVLTGGKTILNSGRSLIVFPQSTRTECFQSEHFNSIGEKLAKSAGVPVLPFALKTDFIANGRFCRDLGALRPERHIWFEFAPLIEIVGNGAEQHKIIVDFIGSHVNAWRAAEGLQEAQ